jgi:glycosyltransferase involved in cell wall biosynthesis
LCVHAAPQTEKIEERCLTRLGLKRTKLGFGIESDQRFDMLWLRHAKAAIETVQSFDADLVHITGPSDVGQLGAYVAHRLRLPAVLSWHTNLHEYAGRRLGHAAGFLPEGARKPLSNLAERLSLRALFEFYKIGRVLLAPNEELSAMLERNCDRPALIMRRGVDTELFSPAKRDRRDSLFTLGYVGRLSPEKNVRLLAKLEKGLIAAGRDDFRIVVVGAGSEITWLRQNMQFAEFPGVLKGEALARAYANFDLFIFPSETDTFGNVVLEAQASGVPAIVSALGGPKFIVQDGATGLVAGGEHEFLTATLELMSRSDKFGLMREKARQIACDASWDKIFEQVYQAYALCLKGQNVKRATPALIHQSMTSSDAAN